MLLSPFKMAATLLWSTISGCRGVWWIRYFPRETQGCMVVCHLLYSITAKDIEYRQIHRIYISNTSNTHLKVKTTPFVFINTCEFWSHDYHRVGQKTTISKCSKGHIAWRLRSIFTKLSAKCNALIGLSFELRNIFVRFLLSLFITLHYEAFCF